MHRGHCLPMIDRPQGTQPMTFRRGSETRCGSILGESGMESDAGFELASIRKSRFCCTVILRELSSFPGSPAWAVPR
jgi:hypothetical protein